MDPLRDDLSAALGARRELGRDYESEVVDAFLERVDRRIDERIDARVQQRAPRESGSGDWPYSIGLAAASMALGIPLSAIAGGIGDLPGLVTAWVGIVGVNVAQAWGRRAGERRPGPSR